MYKHMQFKHKTIYWKPNKLSFSTNEPFKMFTLNSTKSTNTGFVLVWLYYPL